jgi:hypothetical protein
MFDVDHARRDGIMASTSALACMDRASTTVQRGAGKKGCVGRSAQRKEHGWPYRASQGAFLLLSSLALVVPLTVCCHPAWAGAWTVPRNRWYGEYFYRYFGSKKEFDPDGNSGRRAKTATFRDIRNEWKLEYGLTDRLNLLASVPYISSHYRDDNVDLLRTGAGDIHLRTKLRLVQKPVVSSVQFSWKIPSAYDPNENPLGDGQVDVESRVQLSRAWVFAPYEVQEQAKPASERDAAMREAVLLATLYQEGVRLASLGHRREAAKWMAAVLESEPAHDGAMAWLLDEAAALASASRGWWPRVMLVTEERLEPIPEQANEATREVVTTETRYAGVAFLNLEGAFTARNEDPANEFPILFEGGCTPLKRLMLVGLLEAVISVKSTDEQTEDFAKWGARAILNLWGDGFTSIFRTTGGPTVNVEVGYNDVFAGRNTADAFEIFGKIGVFF